MNDDQERIRITTDEVSRVVLNPPDSPASAPADVQPVGSNVWGRIDSPQPQARSAALSAGPNLLLKAWVYLGIAGLLGAFVAWALCEPSFSDQGMQRGIGNILLLPTFVTLMSVAFALAESIVERSTRKALTRCIIALVLGAILGFVFNIVAQFVYQTGSRSLYNAGTKLSAQSPAHWLIRAIAWSVFGVTGGIVYGIAGQSAKKCLYGILGGVIGAGIGGFVFDPVSLAAGSAGPSRCLGLAIVGACTGMAIGLVESALKDRWLYVSAGPLAGKQFILYKQQTTLGRDQANDIYLFKDPTIAAHHAVIDSRSGRAVIVASGQTFVGGQPITQKVLQSGDSVQIGRYIFNYQEKPRST
jgi:heme/copper-type cytochrome/quinol oxidase subunit 3